MMDTNTQTIQKFYIAFKQKDFATMNSCYVADIPFSDPVFGLLTGNETKAMWQMLCTRAKDFSLQFEDITSDDDEYYTCSWTASYLFSKTNKRVVNKCKAYMRMKDGVIIEHSDAFNFYRWCRQALGLPGLLFGWTRWMQKKVSSNAKKGLKDFMEQNGLTA
jgi:ketosteroid isomerase-like protein